MSQGTQTSDMEMETMLTKAVRKLFKWQLSGLTGTLIVASMLWLVVFFVFFLILVFVMCVEYHYEKRERQDAELAIPKDNEKMWAEKRSSRETSNTSMKKVAPMPMPPLPAPVTDEPKPIVVSDMLEKESAEPEPEMRQESPTEAVTEESVIVDAPQDSLEEPVTSPAPPEEDAAIQSTESEQEGQEVADNENPENTQDDETTNENQGASGEGDASPNTDEGEPEAMEETQQEPDDEAVEEAQEENGSEETDKNNEGSEGEKLEEETVSATPEEESEDNSKEHPEEKEEKPPDSPSKESKKGED